jgi:predicted HicB family RNase H-like nuclease
MADNLSVSVTADTSELRAQLALAQADLRAFGAETRKLASDIRSGGDAGGVLRSQLEQVAGQFNNAKSNVVSFTAALRDHNAAHQEAATGIKGVNEALEGMVSPIKGAVGGLGQMAEILGVAFATERLVEFAKEMGELGERTLNMAAAVGTTPEKFSLLSVALGLAGGNAETASRTLERLGKNISTAIATPTSQAAQAFKALGITEAQLQKASTDLEYGLRLLAEKFVEFQDTPSKTAAYFAILGRGMENLVPLFRKGGEGLDEFTAKARDTGAVLTNQTAQAMADTGEKIRVLDTTLEGAGVQGFLALKGAIDTAISGLTSFISWVGNAITAARGLAPAIGAARQAALSDELADINRRIAEGSEAHTRFGGHGSTITTPALEEGEVHRVTRGPRFGQIDTNYNNLATLRARAAELQGQIDQGDEDARQRAAFSFGTGGKPVVPPLEKPEKAAKGGGGHGRATKAETDDSEQINLERIGNEEKVDDLIYDRRTKLIEATKAAGKISLDQEYGMLVDNLNQKHAADENYYQQKMAAAAGDAREQQRLTEKEAADYQQYLTKRQELDIKYFEQRKAAEQKAAADSKAAWDKVLEPLTSSFDTAIKGFIQGTTTLQQALQRAFQSVLLDPLIKNVTNGLKTALMDAFNGTDIGSSFIGKFFSGTLFGGASTESAAPAKDPAGRPRKPNRRQLLTCRVPPELRERLVAMAKEQGRTLTEQIETLLQQALT